jgi:hypothetical protein
MNLKFKDTNIFISMVLNIIVFLALERIIKNISQKKLSQTLKVAFIHATLVILILLFGVNEGSQFIYFQF